MKRVFISRSWTLCLLAILFLSNLYGAKGPEVFNRSFFAQNLLCPDDIEVDCVNDGVYVSFDEFIAAPGASIDFSDGCMEIVDFTMSAQVNVSGNIYQRTYTMTDDCDNMLTCQQLVTVTGGDITFTGCEETVVRTDDGSCMYSGMITPTASNACGVSYTVVADMTGPFSKGSHEIVYEAMDGSTVVGSCTLSLIVIDDENPVLSDVSDSMIDCLSEDVPFMSAQEFVDAGGSISDNCTTDLSQFTISHTDEVSTEKCPMTITRTYTIVDEDANSSESVHIIVVDDNEDPVLDNCPSDVTISETNICDTLYTFGVPDVTENCPIGYTLTNNITGDDSNQAVFTGGTTTVTWTVVDSCGNMAMCSFDVTVAADPRVTFPPLSINTPEDIPAYADLQAFLDAGGSISAECDFDPASFVYNSAVTRIDETCDYLVELTVNLTTNDGVVKQDVYSTTITDSSAPMFDNCMATAGIMDQDVSTCAYNLSLPTATDDFGTANITVVDTTIVPPNISFTFEATDECGNTSSCTQSYVLNDGAIPMVTIADTMVMCIEDGPNVGLDNYAAFVAAGGVATDCNLDTTTFMNLGYTMDPPSWMYAIEDSLGNRAEFSVNVIVDDTTMPTFSAPKDTTLDCGVDLSDTSITGMVDQSMIMDNCTNTMYQIDFSDGPQTVLDCPLKYSFERTWTVTDEDGNEAMQVQLITVQDTIAPVFDSTPMSISDIGCSDPLPTMEILTASDECDADVVVTAAQFGTRNACTDDQIVYQWIATDACGNADTVQMSFMSLADATGPVISAPNVTLSTSPGVCGVRSNDIPLPTVSEDCSNTNPPYIENAQSIYSVGEHTITWVATNDCGIESRETQTITVEDTEAPSITCVEFTTISLTTNGNIFYVMPEMLSDQSDNCAIDHLEVRRMSSTCDASDTNWKDGVSFCCADVAQGFMAEIRAIDASGNASASCMIEVTVQEKLPPVIQAALPDLNISCTTIFDRSDLSVFGTYQKKEEDREDIQYYEHDVLTNAGRDGLVSDVCDFSIVTNAEFEEGNCGLEKITRHFTFIDEHGNETETTQIITVTVDDLFDVNKDVQWPENAVAYGCGANAPGPDVTGAPIVDYSSCSMLSTPKYKDEKYVTPGGGCDKVIREWSFIDMCLYDGVDAGKYTYKQTIVILDTVPPSLANTPNELAVDIVDGCAVTHTFAASGTDECSTLSSKDYTYSMDIDGDGTPEYAGTGNAFTATLRSGEYTIDWSVTDGCNNIARKTQHIRVMDGKAPSLTCIQGLGLGLTKVSANDGSAELWAKDLVQYGSDNCSPESTLRYAFSDDPNDAVRYYSCDDVGNNSLNIYVFDEAGNYDFCSTYVEVQDNSGICPNNPRPKIAVSGRISLESGLEVSHTTIDLHSLGETLRAETDSTGHYSFKDIVAGQDLVLQPSMDMDIREGVTVRDLLKLQRHILNIRHLESEYQKIAADVNNDGRLTPKDLLIIRKVILQLQDGYANNEVWRFFHGQGDEMKDHIELKNQSTNKVNADFVGVKIGDIDGSIEKKMRGLQSRHPDNWELYYTTEHSSEGVLLKVYTPDAIDLAGMQIAINGAGKVVSDGLDLTNEDIAYDSDRIKMVWLGEKEISSNGEVFTIVLDEGSSLTIDQDFEAIAIDREGNELGIRLIKEELADDAVEIFQNRPNPFAAYTDVHFSLKYEGLATIEIVDLNGKLLSTYTNYYKAGNHAIRIDGSDLPHTGVMMLRIRTLSGSKHIKMIKFK